MSERNFDNETKWCDKCNRYQRYLMSVNHSFCIECGEKVRLFSKDDSKQFGEELQQRRWRVSGA